MRSCTYVDLMVMQRSCSSFLVSVALVSPALAAAMMPAFATSESVSVDFPWSTWAITDMFRMFLFLSMHTRTSSIEKFTCGKNAHLNIPTTATDFTTLTYNKTFDH